VPGWSSVRPTVWHMAVVTEGWLRGLANDPDESFPTEGELASVNDAHRVRIGGSTSCCRFSPPTGSPRPSRIPGAAGPRPCPVGSAAPYRQSHYVPPGAGGVQAQAVRNPAGGN
jgi:hypothetical protein